MKKVAFLLVLCGLVCINPGSPMEAEETSSGDRALIAADFPQTYFLHDGKQMNPRLDEAQARPMSLDAGDFDEDGVADLICGYAGPEANLLVLHRGNIDAQHPYSPEAQQRRREGTFTDEPFLESAKVVELAVRPDFLVVGDFDNDGHQDVVVATKNDAQLQVMTGDGRGGLWPASPVELPGSVTTLTAGEINRADGLIDLIVGLRGPTGPAVLVFEGPEGALRSTAEVVAVPALPTALLLGRLGGGYWNDLVVAAGEELLIVYGRDRGLTRGESRQAEVDSPVVERIPMPSAIEDLAWGDFTSEPVGRRELALLLKDGTVRLLARTSTAMERTAGQKRVTRGNRSQGTGPERTWTTIGRLDLFATSGDADFSISTDQSRLIPLRLSGLPTEDLLVLDSADRWLRLITGMSRDSEDATSLSNVGGISAVQLLEPPVAALPMRLNADALSDLVLLVPGESSPLLMRSAPKATITVNSGFDIPIAGDGACILREAIANANGDSDTSSGDCAAGSGADQISFDIGGGGSTATIALSTPLPVITDALTIDGTTQACATPPCIVLDGASAGAGNGLELTSGSCSIRGLVIQQFTGYGIHATSSGNVFEGNFVGTDETGTVDRGNTMSGIRLGSNASNNTVGGTTNNARNILSGNGTDGIFIFQNSNGNVVEGNFIGTDVTGTIDLGNDTYGVEVEAASSNTVGGTTVGARNIISGNSRGVVFDPGGNANLVQNNYVGTDITGTVDLGNTERGVIISSALNNTIGGTAAEAGNLISGNEYGVIVYSSNSTGNQVQGNLIGTDVTGTAALGNHLDGIVIQQAPGNTIGGTTPEARNVISGNGRRGIWILQSTASGNEILGNYIGTDVNGTADLGNTQYGVFINGAPNNTIGGTTAGAGNLISGNEFGVIVYPSNSTGNQVQGNLIGTDVTGTAALGNHLDGIVIQQAPGNTIGGTTPEARNVISGNGRRGIWILQPTASGNEILGNYIGTDVTGTAALSNDLDGIVIEGAPGNTIGGSTAAARNVISGNGRRGVFVYQSTASGNEILGNYIGTDVNGTADLGNAHGGVSILDATNNSVGGTAVGAGNVISGNRFGVAIGFGDGTDNRVEGNLIGTDFTGTVALGNELDGVVLDGGASNIIGGTTPGARNIISGNGGDGVEIRKTTASGNRVLGNFIGTDISGTATLPNLHDGVYITDALDNSIGGFDVGEGNLIVGNGGSGVLVKNANAKRNAILGNSIHSNVGIGIALETEAVWVNDPGDPDLGCNDFQNFPVLTSITVGATDTTVEGTLNSLPNQIYRLEFFTNTACDAAAHGPGENFLGSLDVTTHGSGNATFSQTFPNTALVSNLITATATAADNSTSEFSVCGTDTESDGDTVSDLDDCDTGDNEVWTLPGAAVDLMLSHTGGPGGTTTLSWTVPTPIGGVQAVLVYDTISSADPRDFVMSASCVESDDGSDTMAVHTTAPPAGTALQFLIRAENPCGDGSLGERSDSTARSARDCP